MGAMAICGALCYGALAARYPQAGGGYVYLREAYGPRVAFLYGWKCLLIMDPGITAALATGLATLCRVHRAARRPVRSGSSPSRAIVALALVHVVGVRPGTRLLTGACGAEARAHRRLARPRALSERVGRLAHFVPFVVAPAARAAFRPAAVGALIAAFFSFGGWWEVTQDRAAKCATRRERCRARSCMGLAIVTLVYIATTLAFIYRHPDRTGSASGRRSWHRSGRSLIGTLGRRGRRRDRHRLRAGQPGRDADARAACLLRDGAGRRVPGRGGGASIRASARPRARSRRRRCSRRCSSRLGTFDTIVAYFVFITVVFIALTVAAVFVLAAPRPAFQGAGISVDARCIFLIMVAGLLGLLGAQQSAAGDARRRGRRRRHSCLSI